MTSTAEGDVRAALAANTTLNAIYHPFGAMLTAPGSREVFRYVRSDLVALLVVTDDSVIEYRASERGSPATLIFQTQSPRLAIAALTLMGFAASGKSPITSLFDWAPMSMLNDVGRGAITITDLSGARITFFGYSALLDALGTDWLSTQSEEALLSSAQDPHGAPLFHTTREAPPEGLGRDVSGFFTVEGWLNMRSTADK